MSACLPVRLSASPTGLSLRQSRAPSGAIEYHFEPPICELGLQTDGLETELPPADESASYVQAAALPHAAGARPAGSFGAAEAAPRPADLPYVLGSVVNTELARERIRRLHVTAGALAAKRAAATAAAAGAGAAVAVDEGATTAAAPDAPAALAPRPAPPKPALPPRAAPAVTTVAAAAAAAQAAKAAAKAAASDKVPLSIASWAIAKGRTSSSKASRCAARAVAPGFRMLAAKERGREGRGRGRERRATRRRQHSRARDRAARTAHASSYPVRSATLAARPSRATGRRARLGQRSRPQRSPPTSPRGRSPPRARTPRRSRGPCACVSGITRA